eukprot:1192050-Prorocentrum_minimum.AAC.3
MALNTNENPLARVPTVVREVKQALSDGMCCVIGLQSTGEAAAERQENRSKTSEANELKCRPVETTPINLLVGAAAVFGAST